MAKRQSVVPSESESRELGRHTLGTSGNPWSPEATKLLENVAVDYGIELRDEALKLAQRQGLQQVGTPQITAAQARLLEKKHETYWKKFAGTLGGAFIGCSIGIFSQALSTQQGLSTIQVTIMLVLASVGMGLAVFHALHK